MTPEQFKAMDAADVILDGVGLPSYFALTNRMAKLEEAARGSDPVYLKQCQQDAATFIAKAEGTRAQLVKA